jgi:hypothetical protein
MASAGSSIMLLARNLGSGHHPGRSATVRIAGKSRRSAQEID